MSDEVTRVVANLPSELVAELTDHARERRVSLNIVLAWAAWDYLHQARAPHLEASEGGHRRRGPLTKFEYAAAEASLASARRRGGRKLSR